MNEPQDKSRRRTLSVAVSLLCSMMTACDTVPFYERQRFASKLMAFDDDSTRVHAMQKVFYSREASVGGIGSSAGGGCGCTN